MSERRKIIAGNWKMNKTASETRGFIAEFLKELGTFAEADVILAPSFTSLSAAAELLSGTPVKLAAQNLHEAASGAYTGEISAAMLKDLGVTYVVIGHSERRQYFQETDALILRKTRAALQAGLLPIVCIGETLPERESNRWKKVLETQLQDGLSGLTPEELAQVVLAYEPVWAIGTGKTASPAQAEEAHAFIRAKLAETSGPKIAETLRIQYGGSVKADNAQELLSQPNIDGALVGGASLDAKSFVAIIKNACRK